MPDKDLIHEKSVLTPAEECVGRIVYSVCGRDRKRPFVIVGTCHDPHRAMVLVADGRLHPMASPKLKNLKHLQILDSRVELSGADDERLREYLKSY